MQGMEVACKTEADPPWLPCTPTCNHACLGSAPCASSAAGANGWRKLGSAAGKRLWLGTFNTQEEAIEAYERASQAMAAEGSPAAAPAPAAGAPTRGPRAHSRRGAEGQDPGSMSRGGLAGAARHAALWDALEALEERSTQGPWARCCRRRPLLGPWRSPSWLTFCCWPEAWPGPQRQ